MDLSTTLVDSVVVITVSGEVNAVTAPSLDGLIREHQQQNHHRMVLDLSEAGYVSSAGLRVLLVALKVSRRGGGDLRLAGLQPPVQDVFDMAGFSTLFKIFSDRDQAVASFREG